MNALGRVSFLHGELLGVLCFPGVWGHEAAPFACSAELSLHSHYHQFSPLCSVPAKLQHFPKCLSAGALHASSSSVLGVPAACGAPRDVSMGRQGCGQWPGDAAGGLGLPLAGRALRPGLHGCLMLPVRLLTLVCTAAGTACPTSPSWEETH